MNGRTDIVSYPNLMYQPFHLTTSDKYFQSYQDQHIYTDLLLPTNSEH